MPSCISFLWLLVRSFPHLSSYTQFIVYLSWEFIYHLYQRALVNSHPAFSRSSVNCDPSEEIFCACYLVSTWQKLEPLGNNNTQPKNCSHWIVFVRCFFDVEDTVGCVILRQIELDCLTRVAEQARWGKSVNSLCPWHLLQFLLPSLCLDFCCCWTMYY